MLKKASPILVVLICLMPIVALAGTNISPSRSAPTDPQLAVLVGELTVTGTQTVAEAGQCSFNEYHFSGQIQGTVDDGGGMDEVTFEVWDDSILKDSETISIPVSLTETIDVTLSFEGVYGTGAPGVGLYVSDGIFSQDPFFPEEVQGQCPSEAEAIPTLTEWGMIILSLLLATAAIVRMKYMSKRTPA